MHLLQIGDLFGLGILSLLNYNVNIWMHNYEKKLVGAWEYCPGNSLAEASIVGAQTLLDPKLLMRIARIAVATNDL